MIRAAVIACLFGAPAVAQSQCAPHVDVVAGLAKGYGESLVATGMIDNRHIMQTFANLEKGTWTIIAVDVDGIACLVMSGAMYETREAVAVPGGIEG